MKGLLFAIFILVGCQSSAKTEKIIKTSSSQVKINLKSLDFKQNQEIPLKNICKEKGGENISPDFSWKIDSNLSNLKFALIIDDEDFPCGKKEDACVHWGVFNIPSNISSLKEGEKNFKEIDKNIVIGKTYKGTFQYEGPCPPSLHHYNATLFVLDAKAPDVEEKPKFTRSTFEEKFSKFILGEKSIKAYFDPKRGKR
jgi:Raf kinase inhibitor-like YbhB/YbcL family protein